MCVPGRAGTLFSTGASSSMHNLLLGFVAVARSTSRFTGMLPPDDGGLCRAGDDELGEDLQYLPSYISFGHARDL